MTDVYHGEDIAFDLYPKTDPKNGPRSRRLASLQRGSFIRREQKGTGVVTIVIPGDSDDAEAIDPALGHYIKAERKGAIVNLVTSAAADDIVNTAAAHSLVAGHKLEFVTLTGGTGLSTTPAYYVQSVPSSTSLKVAATKGGAAINFTTDITAGSIRKLKTVAGGFLLGGNYNALSADGTKPLVLTGPGPLHYLARARMAPHSYLGDDPQPEGVWPLHNQGAWFGDDHYGSEFARALTEMKSTQADDPGDDPDSPHPNDNDRLDDPLPALTFDFDGFTDSLGNAWTGARGEFDVQVALEDGLRIAFRFMQAGVEIDIDPDTFELHAYNAGTLGTDRTGLAWGAGVVRFQVPTNDKVDTSNVFTTAKRALSAFIQRSLVWAGREDIWGVARNASAPVRWEGGYSSGAGDEAANNTIAGQQITERTDAGDVPRLKVWAGNDENKGQYTYGPAGHADIWDRGTVHSGTGTWDWNQWTAPLSALEWRIENPNGEFDTYVEFGSTFRSIDEVMRFAGGAVGAHTHPPNPRLCDPVFKEYIGPSTDWRVLPLSHRDGGGSIVVENAEPSDWLEAAFDDSAWEQAAVVGIAGDGDKITQAMRSDDASARRRREQFLLRKLYYVDAADLSGADVDFRHYFDNGGTLYVNGIAVATVGTPFSSSTPAVVDTSIARSAFVEGWNVIGLYVWNEDNGTNGAVPPGSTHGSLYIELPTGKTKGTSNKAKRCDEPTYHDEVLNRNAPDSHPTSSIDHEGTPLDEYLDGLGESGGGVTLADVEALHRFILCAHRHDINPIDGFPENTKEGAASAARRGAPEMEGDVQRSADGTWHNLHDAGASGLNRTSDLTGDINSKTDAQIAAGHIDGGFGYDAGRHGTSLKIPPLIDTLDAIRSYDTVYNFDLKDTSDADHTALAEFIVEHWYPQRAIVNCKSLSGAAAVKAVNPRITTMAQTSISSHPEDEPNVDIWLAVRTEVTSISDVTDRVPERVDIFINVDTDYGADESTWITDAFDYGVRSVMTNNLPAAVATLDEYLYGARGGAGVTDHGALTGLPDDDHPQYLNESRHDALDHAGLGLLTVDAGTPTYDDSGDDVVVTYASKWGYDTDGPYFDSAGVTSGEEAILAMDPTTGELAVIPYNP